MTKRAMTLIEVMIVVLIIAILVMLVSSSLRNQLFKSKDAIRKSDINRISLALEEYEKDYNCYPQRSLVSCANETGLQPYLGKINCDPVTKTSYYYELENSTCPKWYRLYAKLDNSSDPKYQSGIGPSSAFSYVYESPNAPQMTQGSGGVIYYGCFNGTCLPISSPVDCNLNFLVSDCGGNCSNPQYECVN